MPETIDASLPLAESAYRRLRADIISCRLQPGQRITERRLAAETGFGVSPIRDALTRLDHEGLVTTIPRKGYQVTPLTLKLVDDLFTMWQIIGPEVIKRGVVNASAEQIDQCLRDVKEIEKITVAGHGIPAVLRVVELGDDMFATLARASGNSYLEAIYRRLAGEVFRVWTLISDSELLAPARLINVDDWPEALRHRNADHLAECARQYIQACSEQVAATLIRWPSVRTSEVTPLG